MNPSEQKNHKTALTTLSRETADAFDALTVRIAKEISNERTHRLKLADEQRSYVDAADRELRRSMVASDDDLGGRLKGFQSMTLWCRIRWIITGRIDEF